MMSQRSQGRRGRDYGGRRAAAVYPLDKLELGYKPVVVVRRY